MGCCARQKLVARQWSDVARACTELIEHMGQKDGGDLEEQTRIAAEVRAGLVLMPPDPASPGVYTRLLLAQLSEAQEK